MERKLNNYDTEDMFFEVKYGGHRYNIQLMGSGVTKASCKYGRETISAYSKPFDTDIYDVDRGIKIACEKVNSKILKIKLRRAKLNMKVDLDLYNKDVSYLRKVLGEMIESNNELRILMK